MENQKMYFPSRDGKNEIAWKIFLCRLLLHVSVENQKVLRECVFNISIRYIVPATYQNQVEETDRVSDAV